MLRHTGAHIHPRFITAHTRTRNRGHHGRYARISSLAHPTARKAGQRYQAQTHGTRTRTLALDNVRAHSASMRLRASAPAQRTGMRPSAQVTGTRHLARTGRTDACAPGPSANKKAPPLGRRLRAMLLIVYAVIYLVAIRRILFHQICLDIVQTFVCGGVNR